MNIAVIRLKDLIKYAICLILVISIILICISIFKKSSFIYCLKTEIPLMNTKDEINMNEAKISSNSILQGQLALMYNLKEFEEIDDSENIIKNENTENTEIENIDGISTEEAVIIEEIPENIETQVISQNNINAKYTNTANLVKINNQTSFNIKDILEKPSYEIGNKQKVIIYHTHTCESYTSSANYKYEMTGTYRTTDLNYTVSRVGDELEKYLKEYGKTVVHDKTYHDYPAYNGSYGRSLKTMEAVLQNNGDAEIMIDLHRDAIGSSNTYGPTVKIGDEICAQVMFVIGSDGSGLYHPNWRQNFSFAVKMQQKAEEMYPRIFQTNNFTKFKI